MYTVTIEKVKKISRNKNIVKLMCHCYKVALTKHKKPKGVKVANTDQMMDRHFIGHDG